MNGFVKETTSASTQIKPRGVNKRKIAREWVHHGNKETERMNNHHV